jgi:hypothetical protein
MDRTTLLDTIQKEHAKFEEIVALLNEEQLCSPTLEGQWSVKDIMAHIAVWERLCAGWLEEFKRGTMPNPAEMTEVGVNERIYLENRDRSLQEVEEMFHSAHEQFVQQVDMLAQALTEGDLNAPGRFAWTEIWPGHSVIAAIANNSYEHYQDHGEQVRRWIEGSNKG